MAGSITGGQGVGSGGQTGNTGASDAIAQLQEVLTQAAKDQAEITSIKAKLGMEKTAFQAGQSGQY